MKRVLSYLIFLPLLLLSSCGSGGQVTTGLAERDDLSVTMTSANVNIGSDVSATGVYLGFEGKDGNNVGPICWTYWEDKNGDDEMQPNEVIKSDCIEESKPSHSIYIGDMKMSRADQYRHKISYNAMGAAGPIVRTTSIGSLLPF